MQKNARAQPLQAVIQIISCFCFHLGQISYQIFCWMLWRNCLLLTCKWHSKSNIEEIKWNTLAESISRELLSTHQWSWYQFFFFDYDAFQHCPFYTHSRTAYCAHYYRSRHEPCLYTFTVARNPAGFLQCNHMGWIHTCMTTSSLHPHNIIQRNKWWLYMEHPLDTVHLKKD